MKSLKLLLLLSILTPAPALANCPGPGCPANALVGAFVGAVISGNIISSESHSKESRSTKTGPIIDWETRDHNRQIQAALNFFGHDAGALDGVVGPKTRAAIASYQVSQSYDATGVLTEEQTAQLLQNYEQENKKNSE